MKERNEMTDPGGTQDNLVLRIHAPGAVRDGSPLLVLLHGRGADEGDLAGLAPFLPDDLMLVTPRAPFPAGPWGYGPGWAWYRYVAEDRVAEDTLETSLETLDRLMGELSERLPVRPGKTVLGGFSQGGTTSLAWGLTRPDSLAGVVNLSGFLVDSPVVGSALEAGPNLPVFWGHGRQDPNIPFALGERGRRRLTEAGTALETFDHPGGHTITRDEIERLVGWMKGLD